MENASYLSPWPADPPGSSDALPWYNQRIDRAAHLPRASPSFASYKGETSVLCQRETPGKRAGARIPQIPRETGDNARIET